MISLHNITAGYGTRVVLKDFSLTVPASEIWGVIGKSGCGKSTLLNVILGLHGPSHGTCIIGDQETTGKPGTVRGVMFQEGSLLGWLTVLDNVLFVSPKP